MTDSEIAVEMQLTQTDQTYDGVYFALTHSANMPVMELRFTWPTPWGTVRFDSTDDVAGTLATEFYIYNNDKLFQALDVVGNLKPMCTIVFARPSRGTEAFAEWACAPVFSRERGAVSEEADTGDALRIELGEQDASGDEELVATCVFDIPEPGHFGYLCIPGDAGIHTLADLEEALGVENLRAWSREGDMMRALEEITPHAAMIFTVSSKTSDMARIYYQPTEAEALKPGWNLVMLPAEREVPSNVSNSYLLDIAPGVFRKHTGNLQPGKPYWLYVEK